MYWCKVARGKEEVDEIAALNSSTFAEEIPRYELHEFSMRIDPIIFRTLIS